MTVPEMTPSTRCAACGEGLSPDARFCQRCGARAEAPQRPFDSAASSEGEPELDGTMALTAPLVERPAQGVAAVAPDDGRAQGAVSEVSQTNVLVGKLVGLLIAQGFALAAAARMLTGGLLQAALGTIVRRVSDQLLSPAVVGQLGILAQPVRGLVSQVTSGIDGRSLGFPPLPNLILTATLGLIVLAAVPAILVLAAEPAARWQPLLSRVRPAAPAPLASEPLASWGATAIAAAEASRAWLTALLPYAGVLFVLSLLSAGTALLGLLCWLSAGVLALGDQAPTQRPRLRRALPAVYAVATLLMLLIAAQGLRAWGG